MPADTAQIKFIKIQSKLLSEFYGRPIFLRAGLVLPRDYDREPSRRYPLWVRIGGLDARYTSVLGLMGEKSAFRKTWQADDTPRLILLQLDGAGPYGDPYYVNSANNGPFGDALIQELIPTSRPGSGPSANRARASSPALRPAAGSPWRCRSFTPTSSTAPGPPAPTRWTFRALELVNIYRTTTPM